MATLKETNHFNHNCEGDKITEFSSRKVALITGITGQVLFFYLFNNLKNINNN